MQIRRSVGACNFKKIGLAGRRTMTDPRCRSQEVSAANDRECLREF